MDGRVDGRDGTELIEDSALECEIARAECTNWAILIH